eukprot:624129-Prorocentrum_minimum.AAC.2
MVAEMERAFEAVAANEGGEGGYSAQERGRALQRLGQIYQHKVNDNQHYTTLKLNMDPPRDSKIMQVNES